MGMSTGMIMDTDKDRVTRVPESEVRRAVSVCKRWRLWRESFVLVLSFLSYFLLSSCISYHTQYVNDWRVDFAVRSHTSGRIHG